MAIGNIYKNSDTTLSFQLFYADGIIIDVNDLLDITVTIIHKFNFETIATYNKVDLELDSISNYIYVYIEADDTVGKPIGIYKIHTEWSITNLDFPDNIENSVGEKDVFNLLA